MSNQHVEAARWLPGRWGCAEDPAAPRSPGRRRTAGNSAFQLLVIQLTAFALLFGVVEAVPFVVVGTIVATVHAATRVVAMALERERLVVDLRANREELRRSRVRIMEAADHERERIAHDLHDGLQPKLLLLSMEASRAGATEVQRSIDALLDELRTFVYGVMSPVLLERGLYAATEDLADRLPMSVRLEVPATGTRFPPAIEQAAYFVVAETLSNAVKHSQAQKLTVRLEPSADRLRIDVSDDGVGGAAAKGVGLRGIADRVDVLGGRLFVHSPSGAGTRVTVEMPCAL